MNLHKYFEKCRLCPRECGINRMTGGQNASLGFCGETYQLRVAHVGPHFGEEPPITGQNGSGTVFFSGCSLKCSFCQNFQISHLGRGTVLRADQLLERVIGMINRDHVHNINFVTPDHFFPSVFHISALLKERGFDLPIVLNLSGYQSTEMINLAGDYADIYLPDYKYADKLLASELSHCRDYPRVALEAIAEMLRQKGFLEAAMGKGPLAKRGVLVRHLILPGYVENSINALTGLFVEFGPELPVSLMSQYYPIRKQKDISLNRFVLREEFQKVYHHALDLGFEHLYVQFPEEASYGKQAPFLPDFDKAKPFRGGKGGKHLGPCV